MNVDGAPLAAGSIVFVPSGNAKGPKAGGRIENGRFSIPAADGPPFGTLRVEIYKDENLPYSLDDPEAFAKHKGKVPKDPAQLPKIYNSESTLSVTTEKGKPNEFPFNLSSAKSKR
ncbi:MAG TPA: hypothetical protein VGE52_11360 [Pirellulales bacterium]